MAAKKKTTPKPRRGDDRRGKHECKVLRIGLVVGDNQDQALNGAAEWLRARAKALGGNFTLWYGRSSGSPLRSFRSRDISDGTLRLRFTEYHENPTGKQLGYGDVLPGCSDCRCRIEELVIFHHGSQVDEADLGARLVKVIRAIKVPVCRVVWWACNAQVSIEAGENEWTDQMMRALGEFARCRPCGCEHPIELVWPTAGRCHLSGDDADGRLQTNDGKVNRARWGYRDAAGVLHVGPPPGSHTVDRQPPDRDPPYGQPTGGQDGNALGTPIGRKP